MIRGGWMGLLIPLMCGCAAADLGQLADGATTWAALSNGFAEANPVLSGPHGPAILAVKLGVTQVVKLAPPPVCEPGLLGLTIAGYGAALWNVGVMAGSGPAALPVALGLAVWQWDAWTTDAAETCGGGDRGVFGRVSSHG